MTNQTNQTAQKILRAICITWILVVALHAAADLAVAMPPSTQQEQQQ